MVARCCLSFRNRTDKQQSSTQSQYWFSISKQLLARRNSGNYRWIQRYPSVHSCCRCEWQSSSSSHETKQTSAIAVFSIIIVIHRFIIVILQAILAELSQLGNQQNLIRKQNWERHLLSWMNTYDPRHLYILTIFNLAATAVYGLIHII